MLILFFHMWKSIILGVICRVKFWHLRRKPAVIISKSPFFNKSGKKIELFSELFKACFPYISDTYVYFGLSTFNRENVFIPTFLGFKLPCNYLFLKFTHGCDLSFCIWLKKRFPLTFFDINFVSALLIFMDIL